MGNIDRAKSYAIKTLMREDLTEFEAIEIYNKSFIESLFCDGSPTEFEEMSIKQLRYMHSKVKECVDFINS